MLDDNLKLIRKLSDALTNTLLARPFLEDFDYTMPEDVVLQCATDMTTILTDINTRMREIKRRDCGMVVRNAMHTDLEMFIDLIDSTYTHSPSQAIEYFRAYLHYLFHQITICLCGYAGFGNFDDPLVQAIYQAYPGMPTLYEDDRRANCKIIQRYLMDSTQEDLFFCGDIEMLASSGI